jgi:hypothetical protein
VDELVGRRIQLMFDCSPNEAAGLVGVVLGVGVVAVGVVAGEFIGVLVGVFMGIFVGVELVGVELVGAGLVGVGFMVAGGLGGVHHEPIDIDRRARPSSGSTEIDAFLLNRRAVARRWLCSRCSLIVLFLAIRLLVLQSPH